MGCWPLHLIADSTSITADGTNGWWWTDLVGWQEPPAPARTLIPGRPDLGEEPVGDRWPARTIEVTLFTHPADAQAMVDAWYEVSAVLARIGRRNGTLRFEEPDGITRQCTVRLAGQAEVNLEGQVGAGRLDITVPLVAANPAKLSHPINTSTITAGGSISVLNSGNHPSAPIVELAGPSTNPGFRVAGKTVRFTITLTAAQTLTVNVARKTVTLTPGGTDQYGTLNRAVSVIDWPLLTPGFTTVEHLTAGGSGGATVRWRDAWL